MYYIFCENGTVRFFKIVGNNTVEISEEAYNELINEQNANAAKAEAYDIITGVIQ